MQFVQNMQFPGEPFEVFEDSLEIILETLGRTIVQFCFCRMRRGAVRNNV